MLYRHAIEDLRRLDEDPTYNAGFPRRVVRAFRMRMQQIRDAPHENVLRAFKSLHFEKLKGDRKGQYSMRLDARLQLIFEIEEGEYGHTIVIKAIEDYLSLRETDP
jgi:proteic killer suppression protein